MLTGRMSSVSIFLNKSKKQADQNTYEVRKHQVTLVKGKIAGACDENVSAINNNIDNLETKISQAIKGIGQVNTLTGKFADKKEDRKSVV